MAQQQSNIAHGILFRVDVFRRFQMENISTAFLARQRENARSVNLGPNKVTFLISGEETGGNFSLTEFEAAPPPAPAAPLHIHHDADETICILEGEFQVTFHERVTPVHPGEVVFIPRGNPHTIANIGDTRGRMLVFLTPPGFEGYWKKMSQLMAASGGPVDPEVALAVQRKYHVDFLGQTRSFTKR
jgi:mannose-6-phosphate isomerase-like protein (cupin superfamily)